MSKARYNNIFLYASLQFCGNIEEYFAQNTHKLVVFIVMPRLNKSGNVIRLYEDGKLVSEEQVTLSPHILLYYIKWYLHQQKAIMKYFGADEKLTLIGFHPISFFGISFLMLFRKIRVVYWVGDYFPGRTIAIRVFEKVKKYYHDRVKYKCYLSDGINRVLNGRLVQSRNVKTVMWGVKPIDEKVIERKIKINNTFQLLFVGLIKDSQGLDFLFNFITKHREYKVNIIGVCNSKLYKQYKSIISKNKLSKNIFFPNKFYSNNELKKLARTCHAGIALYNVDPSNPTYYTDPGKVKAYAEMWLPVIMTDLSGVVKYIKKYNAGIVIKKTESELERALLDMKKNYHRYIEGLKKFNHYFNYQHYYNSAFKYLKYE